MKKIPCKDCLCFPACKSQAVMKTSQEGEYYLYLSILYNKCELFSKWYISSRYFGEAEVTECFGANSVTWFIRGWWMESLK
jgi:hypothetical protein